MLELGAPGPRRGFGALGAWDWASGPGLRRCPSSFRGLGPGGPIDPVNAAGQYGAGSVSFGPWGLGVRAAGRSTGCKGWSGGSFPGVAPASRWSVARWCRVAFADALGIGSALGISRRGCWVQRRKPMIFCSTRLWYGAGGVGCVGVAVRLPLHMPSSVRLGTLPVQITARRTGCCRCRQG